MLVVRRALTTTKCTLARVLNRGWAVLSLLSKTAMTCVRSYCVGTGAVNPSGAIGLLWLIWVISWFAAAAWSDRTVERPARAREVPYRVINIVGILLLFGFFPHSLIPDWSVWRIDRNTAWAMVALAGIGFAFTWWARIHLGRLWSRSVTQKDGHYIVDTGPYGLVRHPIYTGISLATIATGIMRGTALAFAGAFLLIFSFYIKARLEEQFLRAQLGPTNYDAYKRRVPMLIPFLRLP